MSDGLWRWIEVDKLFLQQVHPVKIILEKIKKEIKKEKMKLRKKMEVEKLLEVRGRGSSVIEEKIGNENEGRKRRDKKRKRFLFLSFNPII